MSKPADEYRAPAWPGLTPRPRVYVPAEPAWGGRVRAALGEAAEVFRLENAGHASSVFLKACLATGSVLFLKIVGVNRVDDLTKAEEIAVWLKEAGVRAMTAVRQVQLDEDCTLWAYTYHEGRSPEPLVGDMRAIGAELGRMHDALSRHPRRAQWLQQTDQRLARLEATRQALAQGRLQAGPEPALLRGIAADRSIQFLPWRYGAEQDRSPLHGDLNCFNMLMDERGCTLLDFEDVAHNVLPPVFDLAAVYERVVLVGGTGEPAKAALLAVLLDAYAEVRGWRPDTAFFREVRRGLALRSLCVLAEIDPQGRDEAEWRKFFRLLEGVQNSEASVPGERHKP